ncbi:MAG TPA: NAD-dependent epimerase/dehydratase family protein [Gemmatimonadaceae bacterium]
MSERILITGGAGFIGVNLAERELAAGKAVTILDNFSRRGSDLNADWLRRNSGPALRIVRADVRTDRDVLQAEVDRADVVFHLAAQVAVTLSVTDPRHDFEVNALGTFNVLDAARRRPTPPIVVYASTNKVYGKMADVAIEQRGDRYAYRDLPQGVDESRPLEFYSPYGCSKGAGDQYMMDFDRIYGVPTVVFRQSCIYGRHQFGIEDQGWLAWFAICALRNDPVTIFGDGRQVRDTLFIDDLNEAYSLAVRHIDQTRGRAYNIGGGPANTLSLLELVTLLRDEFGLPLNPATSDWRPGDQLVYVSDIRRAEADFGWKPRTAPQDGVGQMISWLRENRALLDTFAVAA